MGYKFSAIAGNKKIASAQSTILSFAIFSIFAFIRLSIFTVEHFAILAHRLAMGRLAPDSVTDTPDNKAECSVKRLRNSESSAAVNPRTLLRVDAGQFSLGSFRRNCSADGRGKGAAGAILPSSVRTQAIGRKRLSGRRRPPMWVPYFDRGCRLRAPRPRCKRRFTRSRKMTEQRIGPRTA